MRSKDIELGILKRSDPLSGLGHDLGIERGGPGAKRHAVEYECDRGAGEGVGRPAGSMTRIEAPPFHAAPVLATVSNGPGGPGHDAERRTIDVLGEPIRPLYAVGEPGSSFGHRYLSGGNIAEGLGDWPDAGCGGETLAMSRPDGGNLP